MNWRIYDLARTGESYRAGAVHAETRQVITASGRTQDEARKLVLARCS